MPAASHHSRPAPAASSSRRDAGDAGVKARRESACLRARGTEANTRGPRRSLPERVRGHGQARNVGTGTPSFPHRSLGGRFQSAFATSSFKRVGLLAAIHRVRANPWRRTSTARVSRPAGVSAQTPMNPGLPLSGTRLPALPGRLPWRPGQNVTDLLCPAGGPSCPRLAVLRGSPR